MAENRENRPDIYCPFRVLRVEHPAMLRGHGTSTTEEFYPCLGKRCAAYYPGGCLRLVAPAAVRNEGPEFINPHSLEALAMIERLTAQLEGG